MIIPNSRIEQSQTALLTYKLRQATMDVFRDIIPRAKDLADAGTFSALQSAIIEDTAADIGVVRVAATYHLQVKINETYKQFKQKNMSVVTVDPFPKDTKARLELTINIPLFGQIKTNALIRPGQERLVPGDLYFNLEGGVGSLWFDDALDIIAKVKALNLLSNPTLNETLDPW